MCEREEERKSKGYGLRCLRDRALFWKIIIHTDDIITMMGLCLVTSVLSYFTTPDRTAHLTLNLQITPVINRQTGTVPLFTKHTHPHTHINTLHAVVEWIQARPVD